MDNELNDELNDEWIIDFENEEKYYKKFYQDKITNINLFFVYLNKNNEIIHINKHNQKLIDNTITKELLIHLLNKNSILDKQKYKLFELLQYNITLEPEKINDYIYDQSKYNYLNITNKLDDIVYEDSIMFLNEINSLYVFYKPRKKSTNYTKKIYLKNKNKKTRKVKY